MLPSWPNQFSSSPKYRFQFRHIVNNGSKAPFSPGQRQQFQM
uniref:Uncharacterized protein n=1 Tax=Romanomermis culicivorax TaxID=13658 RepID=A0A915KIL5_ROMCU